MDRGLWFIKEQVSAEFHGGMTGSSVSFLLLMPGLPVDQICLANPAHLSSPGGARQDSHLFTCNQLLPSHGDTQCA